MQLRQLSFTASLRLFLLGWALIATASHGSTTNEYLLKWTPRKLATCQDDARHVAQKLAALGVVVQSASCIKDLGHAAEISLFLDKNSIPSIYSALFGYRVGAPLNTIFRPRPINQRFDLYRATGFYTSFNECLAAVPAMELMFSQQTGLEPLASQCMMVGRRTGYILQIDAIGQPKKTLNRFESLYLKRYVDQATLNVIASKLAAGGFQIVDSRWEKEHLLAIGWGEPKLTLDTPYLYESNYFANSHECESQKSIVWNSLLSLGRSILAVQCDLTGPRPRLLVLEERTDQSEAFFIDVEKMGRFSSMPECISQLSNLPGGASSQFCSLDIGSYGREQGYRMNRLFARERLGRL